MRAVKPYIKVFSTKQDAAREKAGHAFFEKYSQNMPHLLFDRNSGQRFELVYEDRCTKGVQVVTDELNAGRMVNMQPVLAQFSKIAQQYAILRKSQGGSIMFYVDRIDRLNGPIRDEYLRWTLQKSKVSINGKTLQVDETMFERLIPAVQGFTYGLCAPSQGDLHERNILTDGTIVDFEGAGWNLLATDAATFIWHTLFAGSYFGPLYAKWSQDSDKMWLRTHPKQIFTLPEVGVFIRPSKARVELLDDYLSEYLKEIKLSDEIGHDIAMAIAFRLLTTFPVTQMTEEDKHISFSLVQLFMDETEHSLEKKLQLICGR